MAGRGLDQEVQQRGVDGEGLRGGLEVGDSGAGFGGGGGEDGGVGLGDGGEGEVEGAEVGVYCCFFRERLVGGVGFGLGGGGSFSSWGFLLWCGKGKRKKSGIQGIIGDGNLQ